MRRWKVYCSLGLAAVVLAGMLISGCAQTTDYTKEIRDYQEKIEALEAENEELRGQMQALMQEEAETQETETETESVSENQTENAAQNQETAGQVSDNQLTETVSNDETQAAVSENTAGSETESAAETESNADEQRMDDELHILVLGDSIWDMNRDHTGVAAKVEKYLEQAGQKTTIYNASLGGTRATIDPGEDPYTFHGHEENSLPKMVSILTGKCDVECLSKWDAYEEMKAAMENLQNLDMIILAYGMNDFLMQVPLNASVEEGAWTGYGTSLRYEIQELKALLPHVKIMVSGPTYAYYFPIDVVNMGEKALYNYAKVARDVVDLENVLGIDPYTYLGMDAYNEETYLEDGVHLTEAGRDLLAKYVADNVLYGTPGTVSGNALESAE